MPIAMHLRIYVCPPLSFLLLWSVSPSYTLHNIRPCPPDTRYSTLDPDSNDYTLPKGYLKILLVPYLCSSGVPQCLFSLVRGIWTHCSSQGPKWSLSVYFSSPSHSNALLSCTIIPDMLLRFSRTIWHVLFTWNIFFVVGFSRQGFSM